MLCGEGLGQGYTARGGVSLSERRGCPRRVQRVLRRWLVTVVLGAWNDDVQEAPCLAALLWAQRWGTGLSRGLGTGHVQRGGRYGLEVAGLALPGWSRAWHCSKGAQVDTVV